MDLNYCFERTWHGRARLLDACESLSAEEWTREFNFSWKRPRTLFAHIIEVERSWVLEDILRQKLEPLADDFQEKLYGTVMKVRARGADVAADTRGVLKVYGAGRLEEKREIPQRDGTVETIAVGQILTHVYTHELRHQGQLQAMLRLLGKPAPGLDWI